MAYRTIPLTGEIYTTDGIGHWIDYEVDYNGEAFGTNNPYSYSITFDTTYMYANHSGSVTMGWELQFKIGGKWYSVDDFTRTMSKSSSNFDSNGSLPSDVIAALKSGSITNVGVYQTRDSRIIKSVSGAWGTLTINYDEVEPALTQPTITALTQNNDKITITWNHSTYTDGSATRKYLILYKTAAMSANGDDYATLVDNITANTYTGTIPNNWFGQEVSIWVIAYADDVPYSKWSPTASITIQTLGCIRYCYNGQWKECIPYYGTGGQWKECIPYYGYGGVWKEVN